MIVLVINAGSTSIKFKLYNMKDESVLAECNCQRVGSESGEVRYSAGGQKHVMEKPIPGYIEALEEFLNLATSGATKVLGDIFDIEAIGHRFTTAGPDYDGATVLTDQVISDLNKYIVMARLYTQVALQVVEACYEVFGRDFPMVATFDCAFHNNRTAVSRYYAVPQEWTDKYELVRYGYHGLSYQYVVAQYAKLSGCTYEDHCMVACHMGGGGSITPIRNGKSIDNSYGMGMGEGPSGATRVGTFDYTILNYMAEKSGMSLQEMDKVLATQSGLLALSGGVTGDMKELHDLAVQGNERAQHALDYNAWQIKKYIGAFAFELGRIDTLVFTGGAGENSPYMRQRYCENLESFGIKLDPDLNVEMNAKDAKISAADSRVDIWIIPTDEEIVIARDTANVMAKSGQSVKER